MDPDERLLTVALIDAAERAATHRATEQAELDAWTLIAAQAEFMNAITRGANG
jgi:hypothetical protein